jgi:hypothetical protein
VAASAVSVAGASAAARGNPFLWPPSGGGVTSDYLTPTRLRKSESLPISPLSRWLPVANYLPRLTAGMLRPSPRKRRMVSMNLATEIGFDR